LGRALNSLTIEGRVIDATTIVLHRGAQYASGCLVASCRDDDVVDRIARFLR
jgi:hypothetical protein